MDFTLRWTFGSDFVLKHANKMVLFHPQWNFPSLVDNVILQTVGAMYIWKTFHVLLCVFLRTKICKSIYVTGIEEGRKKSSLFF